MTFLATVKRINRRGVSIVLACLLLALCGLAQLLALVKIDAVEKQFPIMNVSTERNLAVIELFQGHKWVAGAFVLVFIGSLLYLELELT